MALYLDPLNGGRQIVLDKAVVLIGRQSDCDVILDNSRKVSRKHCAIAQVNERYMIRDLESMNGVTVNGNRVQREAALQVGDEVAFGDARYVLRDTNAMRAAPAIAKVKAETPAAKPQAVPPALPPQMAAPPQPAVPPRPVNISQKFPVAISDEGVEFAVEPSIQFAKAPLLSEPDRLEPVIELLPDDPASDPPDSRDHDAAVEQLPDVILIDDSGEFDAASRMRKNRRK